jgi:predicted nucleic acid-binding protein
MIVIDSTFLVDLMRSQNNSRHKKSLANLESIISSGEAFGTTFINVFELYNGAYKSDDIDNSIKKINDILSVIPVFELNNDYYPAYGELSARLEKKGTPIGKFDKLIAAIALYHGAKVLTNNTKDFSRVPTLEIINH